MPFIDKMPSLDIGKAGIEKILNEQLIGYPGKREIEVNAFGKEIREISKQKSIQGQNINISIDLIELKYSRKCIKLLYNLGYIHQLLKLYNEAKSYFLKALEIDSLYHESAYGVGYCFESVGDIRNAVVYYQKALDIKSDYIPAKDRIDEISN